jgi:hypothetical protein
VPKAPRTEGAFQRLTRFDMPLSHAIRWIRTFHQVAAWRYHSFADMHNTPVERYRNTLLER